METASMRSWVERWKETGEVLAALKLDEFRHADISAIFLSLTDASPFVYFCRLCGFDGYRN